jgi:hypothetical protein
MAVPQLHKKIFDKGGLGTGLCADLLRSVYAIGQIVFGVEPRDFFYIANGDLCQVSSPQGQALKNGTSQAYKDAFGIVESGGMIPLPDLFDASGKGYFVRAADGSTREVGSRQTDTIRNIEASYYAVLSVSNDFPAPSGAFESTAVLTNNSSLGGASNASYKLYKQLKFNAGACVPTADENRPSNIGLLPLVFLGV